MPSITVRCPACNEPTEVGISSYDAYGIDHPDAVEQLDGEVFDCGNEDCPATYKTITMVKVMRPKIAFTIED